MSKSHNQLTLASRFARLWLVEDARRMIVNRVILTLLINIIIAGSIFVVGFIAGGVYAIDAYQRDAVKFGAGHMMADGSFKWNNEIRTSK